MKIEEMAQNFKEFAELKEFSESQHKTINELSKKIVQLEQEKEHLKDLLEKNTQGLAILSEKEKNEEKICIHQLSLLKEESDKRLLTYEETKKVEIYAKVLSSIRNGEKKKEDELGKKEIGDLLSLVEGEKIG